MQNVIVDRGVGCQFVGSAKEQNVDSMAGVIEVAGDHQTVAAIVALAAADDDPPDNSERPQQIGTAATGVLHEFQAWQSQLANGSLLASADIGTAKDWLHGALLGSKR